ncbi:MAG: hypothetical protein ACHQ9S_04755 [Candidatus Binatia bacterium]
MQDQLIQSERPWVSVKVSIQKPFTFDPEGGTIGLHFLLKNTGHSPAINTNIAAKIIFLWGNVLFFEEHAALCDKLRQNVRTQVGMGIGYTIFPDEEISEDRLLSWDRKEVDAAVLHLKELPPFVLPALIGCVDYGFQFAQGHHQTAFMFHLMIPDRAIGAPAGIEPLEKGEVPGVTLVRLLNIDNNAD